MHFKPFIALLICWLSVKSATAQYNAYEEEETTIPAGELGINSGIFSISNQPTRPYIRMQGIALVADAIQLVPTFGYWFGGAVHVGLCVNVPIPIGRSYIYIGPHGSTLLQTGTGFSYGAQLGANIRITERIYFNAEAGLIFLRKYSPLNTVKPIVGGLRIRID